MNWAVGMSWPVIIFNSLQRILEFHLERSGYAFSSFDVSSSEMKNTAPLTRFSDRFVPLHFKVET